MFGRSWRQLAEQANVGLCLCDKELRVTWVNQRFYELTGTDRTIIGKQFPRLASQAEYDRNMAAMAWLFHAPTERIHHFEREVKRADGARVWVTMMASLVRDGAERQVLVTCHDITTQMNDLVASEARTRQVVETAQDAFVSMDENGFIIEWNTAAETVFGYRRDEVVGRLLADMIIPPDAREAHHDGLVRYLATGVGPILNTRIEVNALRKDGTLVPVELAPWALEVSGKKMFSAFVRDNSEHREHQRKQREFIDELERINDELRKADKLKNEFVSTASHELRTPVTAIGMASDFMNEQWATLSDERRLHFLKIIDRQARRLTALVNDLLIVSRIDAGVALPSPIPLNMREVVGSTIEALQMDVENAVPEYVWAYVDKHHADQMVTNYLANGKKYGRPPYRVEGELAGGQARLRFLDHGDGVPEAFLPSLFTKFARWEGIVNDVEGSGLGLSIVKGLAEANHGQVGYEPVEGGGACFLLLLPTPTADPEPEPKRHSLIEDASRQIGIA